LIASYGESGFWDGSIQARPHPTKADKFQLAFGHHRKEAAKRARLKDLGVVVSKRDNATMLRMMATENAEEFKHSPLVTQETIGAVIEAYGAGEIDLEAVARDAKGHHAQHGVYSVFPDGKTASGLGVWQAQGPEDADGRFVGGSPYTCLTVARFLGWTKADGTQATHACRVAFDAWHAAHRYGVDVGKYIGRIPTEAQSTKATEQILTSVRTATREAERAGLSPSAVSRAAKEAARDVVAEFRGDTSARDLEAAGRAKRIGSAAADKAKVAAGIKVNRKAPRPLPNFVLKLSDEIRDRVDRLLADIGEKTDAVLPYRDQLPSHVTRRITRVLRAKGDEVQRRFHRSAKELEARMVRDVSPQERKRLG
ncbi:hypothetical protein LCGC14_2240610, partial [marine sediment metagenome]